MSYNHPNPTRKRRRYPRLLLALFLLVIAALGFRRSQIGDHDPWPRSSTPVKYAPPLLPTKAIAHYYVTPAGKDGNDGSRLHPWLTIQHAAAVVQPGGTVHVAPGNYLGAITTQTNGTRAARIRFVSDQQWAAIIRASSVDIVWTNLGDYIDIEGFDIAGVQPIPAAASSIMPRSCGSSATTCMT